MRDTDVAPKRAAFREARRDHALAAADYFKIAGRNFEVELELVSMRGVYVPRTCG